MADIAFYEFSLKISKGQIFSLLRIRLGLIFEENPKVLVKRLTNPNPLFNQSGMGIISDTHDNV